MKRPIILAVLIWITVVYWALLLGALGAEAMQ